MMTDILLELHSQGLSLFSTKGFGFLRGATPQVGHLCLSSFRRVNTQAMHVSVWPHTSNNVRCRLFSVPNSFEQFRHCNIKEPPHPCHYYILVFLIVSTDIKTMHHNVESGACEEKTIRIVGFGGTKGEETYSARLLTHSLLNGCLSCS